MDRVDNEMNWSDNAIEWKGYEIIISEKETKCPIYRFVPLYLAAVHILLISWSTVEHTVHIVKHWVVFEAVNTQLKSNDSLILNCSDAPLRNSYYIFPDYFFPTAMRSLFQGLSLCVRCLLLIATVGRILIICFQTSICCKIRNEEAIAKRVMDTRREKGWISCRLPELSYICEVQVPWPGLEIWPW